MAAFLSEGNLASVPLGEAMSRSWENRGCGSCPGVLLGGQMEKMAATAALPAAAVGEVAAGKSGLFPVLTVTLALATGLIALAAACSGSGSWPTSSASPCSRGSSSAWR
jgi:hypothetical protein